MELRANGFADKEVKEALAFATRRMDLFLGKGTFEELDQAQEAVKDRPWFAHVHRCDRALFESARRMCGHDSEPSWERVHCPVLVIYGDHDVSSGPPEPLVNIIRRGLTKAGNKDVTVRIFPNANHSLCRADTGSRKDRGVRTKEDGPAFVPGYLDAMTSWLDERLSAGR